ncbi:uncharacterized protein RJT20DRAFT_130720 [Scheffersomyces xylosifermentans]|uniref:uncharacterized protein n=1 Tax=Scheffersomyces xylosifermentans TaxID=1304137 RepID=UPI00315C7757
MSAISYVTPDADAAAADELDTLIECISQFHVGILPKVGLDSCDKSKPEELNAKLEILQEYFMEVNSLLAAFPIETHHFLWLSLVKGLVTVLRRFRRFYCEKYLNSSQYDAELYVQFSSQVAAITSKFDFEVANKLNASLASNWSVLRIIQSQSSRVLQQYFDIIHNALDIVSMDNAEDLEDSSTIQSILNSCQVGLLRYYHETEKFEDKEKDILYSKAFSILTYFLKVIYTVGYSSLIIPLIERPSPEQISIVNPRSAIHIVRTDSVALADLMNYYKFAAFNLLTLSIENSDYIKVFYNLEADIYFRVLLHFPNLRTSVYLNSQFGNSTQQHFSFGYDDKRPRTDDFVINLLERQEISLMFILNYILKSTDLREIQDAASFYTSELIFLQRSLSASLSVDLDKSASRPGSTHSSVVSFPKLNQMEQEKNDEFRAHKVLNKLKLSSLSSVISHGSYKEKQHLIIQFCESLEKGNFKISNFASKFDGEEANSSFSHIGTIYPGKSLFVKTLNIISRLLVLLGIKFLVDKMGVNELEENYLTHLLSLKVQVAECLNIKSLLKYDVDLTSGKRVYHFSSGNAKQNEVKLDSELDKLIKISNLTNELNDVANTLK